MLIHTQQRIKPYLVQVLNPPPELLPALVSLASVSHASIVHFYEVNSLVSISVWGLTALHSLAWFLSLLQWFPVSSILLQMTKFHSFNDWIIFHCAPTHAKFSLSTLQPMDTWVTSILWILRVVLQWTWECGSFFNILMAWTFWI